MSQNKRIFIVGHPGVGKAVLAKLLSEKLGWEFINADFGLELRVGRSLDKILGKQGEEVFHHCESEILMNQLGLENIVVTTDASIVCDKKNRQILSKEFVVHLQASTSVQIERLLRNPIALLPVDMKNFLDNLHHKRDNLYEQIANLTIDSDDNSLEVHVSKIMKNILSNEKIEVESLQFKLNKNERIFFHRIEHIPVQLSDQQALCLKLLAQGKSSKEIAQVLTISNRTVERHIANLMEILGCSSSKELIALYHIGS